MTSGHVIKRIIASLTWNTATQSGRTGEHIYNVHNYRYPVHTIVLVKPDLLYLPSEYSHTTMVLLSKLGFQRKIFKGCVTNFVRNLSIRGIFPPIATPFGANEELDYNMLSKNLSLWSNIPFRGQFRCFLCSW